MAWNIEDVITDMNNSPAFVENCLRAEKSVGDDYSMDVMDETDSHCFLYLVNFEKSEKEDYYERSSSSDEYTLSGQYHYGADILEEGQTFCLDKGMTVDQLASDIADYLKSFRKVLA